MPVRYEHTQVGHVLIVSILTPALVLFVAAAFTREPALIVVGAILLAVVTQMATLTTKVADGTLEVRMGPGLIRRRIDLRDVQQVAVVGRLWLWGWGIRLTARGWQWNVSGTRGVELTYRNGRRFRIGSDEPEALAAAVASWLDKGAHVHL